MFKLNINRFILALLCFFTWSVQSTQAQEVVVYSARIEQLIKPMFDAFTKETGIKVKYTTDNEGALLAKLEALEDGADVGRVAVDVAVEIGGEVARVVQQRVDALP